MMNQEHSRHDGSFEGSRKGFWLQGVHSTPYSSLYSVSSYKGDSRPSAHAPAWHGGDCTLELLCFSGVLFFVFVCSTYSLTDSSMRTHHALACMMADFREQSREYSVQSQLFFATVKYVPYSICTLNRVRYIQHSTEYRCTYSVGMYTCEKARSPIRDGRYPGPWSRVHIHARFRIPRPN